MKVTEEEEHLANQESQEDREEEEAVLPEPQASLVDLAGEGMEEEEVNKCWK